VNHPPIHWLPGDPGTRWLKDPGVRIDIPAEPGHWKVLTPDVVALPGGGLRMYYTLVGPGVDYTVTQGNILSAVSDDGEHWEKEPGVRVGPHEPEAGLRVVCPDVVPLPEGGYRMYFEAQPPDRPARIGSARSDDGLSWEPEPGARFGDDTWRYGSPRGVPLPDGRWRLYLHRYTHPVVPGPGNHIISAISSDGLAFDEEPGIRIPQTSPLESFSTYAAEVVGLGSAHPAPWRMYYAGWTADPVRGRIFSATSLDGLVWTKDPEPSLEPAGLGVGAFDAEKCSEPSVAQLPDGRYRLYYEACDEGQVWRILSATAAAR
jgi:hypothetical protein